MDKKDYMGRRGENISFVRLTEVCQANDLPYFLPHFLGDKCPLFDALVELIGADDKTPFFFAQVKSTRLGYNKAKRLQVEVPKDDVVKMPVEFKKWFVTERARALAMVLLTRREDLEVQLTKSDSGLDYTVRIQTDEEAVPKVFGIVLRATMSPITIQQANAQLKPTMGGLAHEGEAVMPLCVFYFTVKDDHGYYTWGYEPVIVKGQLKLRRHADPDCRSLDDESVEEIITRVSEWYDALAESMKI